MEYDKDGISAELEKAKNLTELVEIKNRLTKKLVGELQLEITNSNDAEKKKQLGLSINEIKKEINNIFSNIKDKFELDNKKIDYKFHDPITSLKYGKEHILNKINNDILNIFKEIGFDIKNGNDIVSTYWNFDALNIPKNHPARAMHDSFFFNDETILKTHNTSYSAYYLSKSTNKDDIRICTYGPVFRKDDDDATHSHQFMQIDMVWVKKGLNIANLKWIVDYMLKKIFGSNIKTRYRLSFFPFTEPSFEVDISCFNCNGKGCPICKYTKWIEVLGAGVLHKNVLKNVGFDPEQYQGIAFGVGIERIAMLKYQIEDIRNFYTDNFAFLKQFN